MPPCRFLADPVSVKATAAIDGSLRDKPEHLLRTARDHYVRHYLQKT